MQTRETGPLDPAEVEPAQSRVGILGPQFLIIVTYLTVRQTKKKRLILGVSQVVQGLQWGPLGL